MASKVFTKPGKSYFFNEARLLESTISNFHNIIKTNSLSPINTCLIDPEWVHKPSESEKISAISSQRIHLAEREFVLRPNWPANVFHSIHRNGLERLIDMPSGLAFQGPVFRASETHGEALGQSYEFGVQYIHRKNRLPEDFFAFRCAYRLLFKLVFINKLNVFVNNIGDAGARNKFRGSLQDHFNQLTSKKDRLTPEMIQLLERDPIRLLRALKKEDKELLEGIPKLSEFTSVDSKKRFDLLLQIINDRKIQIEIDETLIRTSDIYNDFTFDMRPKVAEFEHLPIIVGGRFDSLWSKIAPESTSKIFGVGFTFIFDRYVKAFKLQSNEVPNVKPKIYIVAGTDEEQLEGFKFCHQILTQAKSSRKSWDIQCLNKREFSSLVTENRGTFKIPSYVIDKECIEKQALKVAHSKIEDQPNDVVNDNIDKIDNLLKNAGVSILK